MIKIKYPLNLGSLLNLRVSPIFYLVGLLIPNVDDGHFFMGWDSLTHLPSILFGSREAGFSQETPREGTRESSGIVIC